MQSTQVGVVAAIAIGLVVGLVKCEARSQRRKLREASEQAEIMETAGSARQQTAIIDGLAREELEKIEASRPAMTAEAAAYDGPLPEYADRPAVEGGDNAKVLAGVVRDLKALEKKLTPEQVRMLRVTLLVYQQRYQGVTVGSISASESVGRELEAAVKGFLSPEQRQELRAAAMHGSYDILISLGPVRVR